jgi:murein DD-endopeptidase MepM/ murein hydrolase activator NlpD
VQSYFSTRPAPRGTGALPRGRARIALGATLAGVAILAIAAGTLLPSREGQLAADPAAANVAPALRHQVALPAPQPVAAEPATQRFTGVVGANLTDALRGAGVPLLQGREYVAVLGRAIRLGDGLSVDDRFDLVLLRDPDSGKLGQLVYVGMDRVARADVELMKWTDGKHIIWVNGDGVGGEEQGAMGLPVHGRVSSAFGERFHPILGYVRMHKGVDLAAAAGTPIVAAADGKVVGAGWHGGYGEQVQIAHASGLETSYGHMSRIAAHIGQVVRKGEVIGWVGSTGLATGPHVHFEVTRNGRVVNPLSVKMDSGPGHLQGEKLEQFDATLRGILLGSAGAS